MDAHFRGHDILRAKLRHHLFLSNAVVWGDVECLRDLSSTNVNISRFLGEESDIFIEKNG